MQRRQLYDTKPVANEDCGSMLPDVAERAKEVVPVQDRSRRTFASLMAQFRFQGGHASALPFLITAIATLSMHFPLFLPQQGWSLPRSASTGGAATPRSVRSPS